MHGTPNPYGPPPPPPMPGRPPSHAREGRARGWVIVALAVVALAVIAGLAAAMAPDDEKPAAAATPPAKATSTPSMETWEYVPAARRTAFVAYLRRLDPGLTPTSTGARPRPLRRAVSVCWDIYDGKSAATVLRNTALRYNGGQASVPEGSEKARRILAAAKRWICSSPELRAQYDARHP
ncbi:hypothetical protein [Actinomadura decatromicini]|uniref:DUF732 domain-containing protein n=1 Tax=Actinomadura decatromicini TaxID=2604572 RepID=A0A5D3FIM5_9ACTN|nr:hypothetical protein [Actinomadura decatromicini]TYK47145.1 hypothetical protein FXF68_25415 [Actinomadura decatromicini]